MSPETYYEILGISENADDDAVKQAFRDLAKHFHPDRNPNDEDAERQFKRINTAYEGLKDASRREAYNEWLEFAHKREKVKRTQWGRLAALVFLLLLGPSAVLYWAVVIADIPLFADNVDKVAGTSPRREIGLPPPRPERRQPLSPSETAPPDQRTAIQSEPAPQPVTPPPATEPVSSPAPETPPAPATVANNQPPADRPNPGNAPETGRNTANSGQNNAAPSNPSPAAKNGAPGAEKNFTQSLPRQPSFSEVLGETEADTASEATNGPAPDNSVNALPAPDQGQGGAVPQGDSARATARMLARLKEPEGAQSGAAIPSETVPPATENANPPFRDGLPPEAFADCDECPLISAAGSNEMLGGSAKAAISLTEITLADWDGCVVDRACPVYERPARATRRDTVVEVGPRDAEAYVAWLSATSGKNYRLVMSPRRREAAAQRCDNARRNSSGWEWLDDNSARNCPPPSAAETGPDAPRGFRVFRKVVP
jgi:hypothetical protein